MTDRIALLLREQADSVPVPVPDTAAVLRGGQRRRRRRHLGQTVGVVALVVAVLGVGVAVRPSGGRAPLTPQERFDAASPGAAYTRYGAFSAGSVVYIGNHRVRFEDKIKALYYTSAGVLVRAGRSGYTDSSGPSRYTLIAPDGSVTTVPLRMGDRVPGTDIDSPDVAYAAPTRDPGRWSYVVVDVTTGREVARTEIPGRFTWGGWEAPPVSMTGTTMWAHFDDGWTEWDWSTGRTRQVPDSNRASENAHGRFAVRGSRSWVVRDFTTDTTVSELAMGRDDYGFVSPDGRFLRYFNQMAVIGEGEKAPQPRFYDVDAGTSRTLSRRDDAFGWTPDGRVLMVDAKKDTITTCDAATGACQVVEQSIDDAPVKLGGESYES